LKPKTYQRGFIGKTIGDRSAKETGPVSRERPVSRDRPASNRSRDTESKRFANSVRDVKRHRDSVVIRKTDRDTVLHRPRETKRVIYEDRANFGHRRHHEHAYRDWHNRLHFRIIWPGFSYGLFYDWGPYMTFNWVYPYYQRRYVFVSLGGYWPVGYQYMRYYWYPCHSYYWYGYDPVAREISGDTYNYYTYNYYNSDNDSAASYSANPTAYADAIRAQADTPREPLPQTKADDYFDDGVKAFENGDYADAADRFAQAMSQAPEDVVLPFAYAQALFADGRYQVAAQAIRSITEKVSPQKEGIYYPRGLYVSEDTLYEQINHLTERAKNFPAQPDIQLLLGYQLLGIGQIEKSIEVLRQASLAPQNAAAAAVLLDLAEKINAANADQNSD